MFRKCQNFVVIPKMKIHSPLLYYIAGIWLQLLDIMSYSVIKVVFFSHDDGHIKRKGVVYRYWATVNLIPSLMFNTLAIFIG